MTDIELRRMEMDAQEKREQREAAERRSNSNREMFKWFIVLVWPPIIQVIGSYYQASVTSQAAAVVKEEAAANRAVVKRELTANKAETDKALSDIGSKVDVGVAAAVNTDAIYTKSIADRTGSPDDMAKAEAAEKRLDAVAEKMP